MKTLLIDLDGVLNKYTGNYQENYIPVPKKGSLKFLKEMSKKYTIKIFTSRNIKLAEDWVKNHRFEKYISGITNIKEPCFLYIDDRCINFQGSYELLSAQIEDFKPYYKY